MRFLIKFWLSSTISTTFLTNFSENKPNTYLSITAKNNLNVMAECGAARAEAWFFHVFNSLNMIEKHIHTDFVQQRQTSSKPFICLYTL